MLEILQLEFMQNAIIAGLIIGLISPLVGLHLVLRRLAMMSEGLSHVTLSGVATGLIIQKNFIGGSWFNPLYMGMCFAVFSSLILESMRRVYRNYQEVAIPILLSGGIALGVVLITAFKGSSVDMMSYLFGSIMGVNKSDLLLITVIGLIVLAFLGFFYKELFAISFDDEYAALSGISCRALNFLFMVIVALVISSALSVVGILLVSALMTIPVATSFKITQSFKQALILSVLFSELSIFGGLISAYFFDLAPGGAIVLCSILIMIIVLSLRRFLEVQDSYGKSI